MLEVSLVSVLSSLLVPQQCGSSGYYGQEAAKEAASVNMWIEGGVPSRQGLALLWKASGAHQVALFQPHLPPDCCTRTSPSSTCHPAPAGERGDHKQRVLCTVECLTYVLPCPTAQAVVYCTYVG